MSGFRCPSDGRNFFQLDVVLPDSDRQGKISQRFAGAIVLQPPPSGCVWFPNKYPPVEYMGDRQTDKTSRWAFTAYQGQYALFTTVNPLIAEMGWQKEICPDTQREHYQGFIRTTRQVRFAQLAKIFPGVHIEPAKNWDALLNYCRKSDTAIQGSQVHLKQPEGKKPLTMAQALTLLASNVPYVTYDWSEMDEKKLKEIKDQLFWKAVENTISYDLDLVGIFTQPQYYRAFMNLKQVWIDEAIDLAQTDRQTDEDCVYPGPMFLPA